MHSALAHIRALARLLSELTCPDSLYVRIQSLLFCLPLDGWCMVGCSIVKSGIVKTGQLCDQHCSPSDLPQCRQFTNCVGYYDNNEQLSMIIAMSLVTLGFQIGKQAIKHVILFHSFVGHDPYGLLKCGTPR